MAKKILILSASPRKGGNSDLLCDQFLRGAKEAGHEAVKIFLRKKEINHCVACGSCQENGGTCVQKDDMAEVLDKMTAADVIAMATPVYFYTMNGQMETVIDRTYARYMKIGDKDMYFLMTAATGSKQALERTLEGFRGFTSCLKGAKEQGVVYGTGVWKMGDITKSKTMSQAYEMGKNV